MWSRRHACLRQIDRADCGPAALATIARHHHVRVARHQLRATTLAGLADAGTRLGFACRVVHATFATLATAPLPAIAHTRTGYVVIHEVRGDSVVIADPACGLATLRRAELELRWTGSLLLLVPARAPASAPAARLSHLLLAHRPSVVSAWSCALAVTALALVASLVIERVVDTQLLRGDHQLVHALAIGGGAVIAFALVFGALRRRLRDDVARHTEHALAADYTRHLVRSPLRLVALERIGQLLAGEPDVAPASHALAGVMLTAVVDITVAAIAIIAMWLTNVEIAAGTTACVLLAFVIGHSRRVPRAIVLFAHGEIAATVVALGGFEVARGRLSLGQLVVTCCLVGVVIQPLARLAAFGAELDATAAMLDRLYRGLALALSDWLEAQKSPLARVLDAIELRGVTFHYPNRTKVLDRVDVTIPAGKTVAIVGDGAASKSAIVKLLTRFHDPSDGHLLFDGIDARDLDTSSVRGKVELVMPEPFIFTGSIRDNIALGHPDAAMEAVRDAALQVGLGKLIIKLPDRFSTVIGKEGASLSSGQRQRIAIARALLGRHELLVFDESTTHLDVDTERAILDTLATALAGRTVLFMASRASTARAADLIYVLDAGRIVETGTHDELLTAGGKYAELARAQHAATLRATNPTAQAALISMASKEPGAYAAALAKSAPVTPGVARAR